MKVCSICNQTYTDENLNFCLNDGGVLTLMKDDAPPTIFMNQVRTTQPNWENVQQPISPWQNQPLQANQAYMPAVVQGQNQTLATVSLCLGIASVTVGWCCSLGLILSPAALITGFIALSQIKKNPQSNGGKGLAIGGIVTGAIYLAVFVLIIVIYGMAIFFGNIR